MASKATSKRPKNSSSIDSVLDGMRAQMTIAKQRAEEDQTLPAFPVEYTNPMFLAMQGLIIRQKWDKSSAKSSEDDGRIELYVRQTFLGQKAHYSSVALEELKPVLLKDMKVRHRHEGQYLLCRIIVPPNRMVCTTLTVEDSKGWAQLISLYNYPGTYFANGPELDTLFPVNTVIAIREPHLKMALAESGSHIRVDSPTDFIIIEPESPIHKNVKWTSGDRPLPVYTKTASEWKAIGDKHFKAKEYYAAIAGYSFALQRDPSTISVRLNRSLANLRAGRNLQSMEDARNVLSREHLSPADQMKALYRCAQAMYAEANYAEAKDWYSKCVSVDSKIADAVLGSQRCDSRMKERQSGQYNWPAIAMHASKNPSAIMDIADFIGSVEKSVMSHRGGGRGVVASRNINAGQLLVVAKPFAFADPKVDSTQGFFVAMDFLTNRMQKESQYILIQRAMYRAAANPQDAATLLDLYAGPGYASGTTHSTPDQHREHENTYPATQDLDSSRIEAACLLNSFQGGPTQAAREASASSEDTPTALYTFPSYFNHSCLPNAGRESMGSILVIRAMKPIHEGEEVTISYCQPDMSYKERTQKLKMWLERCDCAGCDQDRSNGAPMRSKRKQLLDELKRSRHNIDRLRSITKEIDSNYSVGYGSLRPDSAYAHEVTAAKLEGLAMQNIKGGPISPKASALLKESLQETFKSLAAIGFCEVDMKTDDVPASRGRSLPVSREHIPCDTRVYISTFLRNVGRFILLGNMRRAEMWMRAAMWLDSVWNGNGIGPFKSRWRESLDGLGECADALIEWIEVSKSEG